QLLAYNRDGSYQRMVTPFPSSLSMERVKGIGAVELNGKPAPRVHNIKDRNYYSFSSVRGGGMAVTSDGVILKFADGSCLAAVDSEGGIPWDTYEARLLEKGGVTRPFVAVSSDNKWAYVSGLAKGNGELPLAAVYRIKLPERHLVETFFGVPETPGSDESHL